MALKLLLMDFERCQNDGIEPVNIHGAHDPFGLISTSCLHLLCWQLRLLDRCVDWAHGYSRF